MKLIRYGLMGIVVLVATMLIALSFEYDSPKLGQRVLALASDEAGVQAQVRDFKLAPFKGLVLKGFEATTAVDGGVLSVAVDSLTLRHRFWPLLTGELIIDEVVLVSPHLELIASDQPISDVEGHSGGDAKPASSAVEPAIGIDVVVRELRISNGSVLVLPVGGESPEQAATRVTGLDLVLESLSLAGESAELLLALSARGSMTAAELQTDSLVATDVESHIQVSDGHLLLSELELASEYGPMVVPELDLDLTKEPFTFELAARGPRLDLGSTLGALGEGLGDIALELETLGDLSESMRLEGGGRLVFTSGRLPESKILRGVQQLLPGVPLVGAEYEPFEIAFQLRDSRVVFEAFDLVLEQASLTSAGSVGLDLSVALALTSRFPRQLLADTKEIPEEILDVLTDIDGMVNVPLLVTGQRENPTTAFDRSQWKNLATQRLRNEAKNELGRQLGKLFGGE